MSNKLLTKNIPTSKNTLTIKEIIELKVNKIGVETKFMLKDATIPQLIRYIMPFFKFRLNKSQYTTFVNYLMEVMPYWKLPKNLNLNEDAYAVEYLLIEVRRHCTTSEIVKSFINHYNVSSIEYIDDYDHPSLSEKFKQLEKITDIAYKLFYEHNDLRGKLQSLLDDELFNYVTEAFNLWTLSNCIPLQDDKSYCIPSTLKEFAVMFKDYIEQYTEECKKDGSFSWVVNTVGYRESQEALKILEPYTHTN